MLERQPPEGSEETVRKARGERLRAAMEEEREDAARLARITDEARALEGMAKGRE